MDNEIDGRQGLIDYVRALHPRIEIPLAAILPGGTFQLPLGFEITDYDSERVLIAGPFETIATVRTQSYFGGDVAVSGEKLTAGLMLAAHVGEPIWDRSLDARKAWRLRQFEDVPAFTVTIPEPRTREELELHIASCASCATVAESYGRALDAGMNASDERALRELVDRSHADVAGAVKFYRDKEAVHRGTLAPTEKPTRRSRRAERTEEVPA
jgi:hypothetical protein